MAVVGALYRLSWGGSIYGLDQWVNSLHILAPSPMPTNPQAYQAAVTAYHDVNMVGAKVEFIKFNEIVPATGKYLDQAASNTFTYEPAIQGQGGYTYPQLTMAVTFFSAKARGRGSKGRIYPPNVQDDGLMGMATPARVTAVTLASKDFLNALNAANGGTGKCVIFSKADQACSQITRVGVGKVVDTQRRRRLSFKEEHEILALA